MSINELFHSNTSINTGARGLPGTAELTNLAANMAHSIIKTMENDIETYKPRIQSSALDARELDILIEELSPEYGEQADFLKELDDAVVDGILKSQQSKRSRAKGKAMTLDNYHTLMTAAIAEKLIRDITGRTKTYIGRGSGVLDYTGAQLEELAADQNALRREIRNVQSKKSIMKSKADFDESDERWLALLKAEQQLKDLRIGATPHVVEVDTTKDALTTMLAETDIDKLNSKEAHELLKSISDMINN